LPDRDPAVRRWAARAVTVRQDGSGAAAEFALCITPIRTSLLLSVDEAETPRRVRPADSRSAASHRDS
jgi:hypothetical protein